MSRIFAFLLILCLAISTAQAFADVDYESDYEAALTLAMNDLTNVGGLRTAVDMLQRLGSYKLSKSYLQYLQPILDLMSDAPNIAVIRIRIEACTRNAVLAEELAERGFPSCEDILNYIAARELETAGDYESAFEAYAVMVILDAPDRMQMMIEAMMNSDSVLNIRYVDTEGAELDSETEEVPRGSKKTFTARTFDGYGLIPDCPDSVTVTVDAMGMMSRREVVFTYRRLPDMAAVTVIHRTEDGTELARETVEIGYGETRVFTARIFEGYGLLNESETVAAVTVDQNGEPSRGEVVFLYEAASLEELLSDFRWEYGDNETHDLSILGYDGVEQTVMIPYGVTVIGDYAFYDHAELTAVVIPESVTSIGDSAFSKCTGLTDITIPESVTRIELYAFSGCTALKTVTIPGSVTSIGVCTFSGCTGLTAVKIPDSVTGIAGYAFSGCVGLTSVVIPESVTSIGNCAFRGCTGLTSVAIPGSVTGIGDYAFGDCTSLTSVAIPDSVTGIGSSAFRGCFSLTTVTIPDSVTSIRQHAFQGCPNLKILTSNNMVIDYCRENGIPCGNE